MHFLFLSHASRVDEPRSRSVCTQTMCVVPESVAVNIKKPYVANFLHFKVAKLFGFVTLG